MIKDWPRRARSILKAATLDTRSRGAAHKMLTRYLGPLGWFESMAAGEPLDREGPLPFYTYPFLAVLRQVVTPELRVFEYGCGNSSRWWAPRVKELVSVEHNEAWADRIRTATGHDLRLVPADSSKNEQLYPLLGPFFELGLEERSMGGPKEDRAHGVTVEPFLSYAAEMLNFPEGYFDVVIVDGMARVLTAWVASQRVRESGFVIFDNSDREAYADAYALLERAGFARIDFFGPGPSAREPWCTSLFAKSLEPFKG